MTAYVTLPPCSRYTLAIDKSTVERRFGAKFYIADKKRHGCVQRDLWVQIVAALASAGRPGRGNPGFYCGSVTTQAVSAA
jgi:hypothetical protein